MNQYGNCKHRRTRRARGSAPDARRTVKQRRLRDPLPYTKVFSADDIVSMDETAPGMLEEMRMQVLLTETARVFRNGRARAQGRMIGIRRETIETAPALGIPAHLQISLAAMHQKKAENGHV